MIGWIVTEAQAAALEVQIRAAFAARGRPQYWLPGAIKIATGDHAGKMLIPMSDQDKSQRLTNGTRVMDYPEYAAMSAQLGGEESRVDVDPADFYQPTEEP